MRVLFWTHCVCAGDAQIAPMEDIDEGDGTDLSLTQRKSRAESRKPRRLVRKPNNIKHELIVLKKLGHGASGTVNLALHVPSMQLVAVKYLRVFDPNARRSIVQELRTLYANMVPLLNSSGMNVNQAIGMSPGEAPPRPLIPHPAKQGVRCGLVALSLCACISWKHCALAPLPSQS